MIQRRQDDRRHRVGVDLVARQEQLVGPAREAQLRQRGALVDERIDPQHAVALREGRVGVGGKRVGAGSRRRVFGRDLRGRPAARRLERIVVERRLVLDRRHREELTTRSVQDHQLLALIRRRDEAGQLAAVVAERHRIVQQPFGQQRVAGSRIVAREEVEVV